MAKNSNAWILIVLVVAAILLVPMGIGSLTNAWNDFWGKVWAPFGSEGNYTGGTAVSFKVLFADGTSKDFHVAPLSLIPLMLTVDGKEISSVKIYVQADLRITGKVSAWKTVTKQQIELYKKPETTPKKSATANIEKTGTEWLDGELKFIAETELSWQMIEDAILQYGEGDWFLNVGVSVTLTVTIDGKSDTSSASAPSGGIDFTYANGGIDQFTVYLAQQPIYP